MTVEELQAKLEEKERELADIEKEKERLTKNESNQNSYITKLEETKLALENQIETIKEATGKPALDPAIAEYFKKRYVSDFVNDGIAEIKRRDGKGVFPILENDLTKFLKEHMTEKNASMKFVLDAYSLLLGRAYADPGHEIHKTKDNSVGETKVEEPKDVSTGTNEFPPTISDSDQGAGTPASVNREPVPDTKAAFKALEDKLFNAGKNKFE